MENNEEISNLILSLNKELEILKEELSFVQIKEEYSEDDIKYINEINDKIYNIITNLTDTIGKI